MKPSPYLDEALEQARLAESQGEVPVGAVVVCDGKIIAKACNNREQANDPCGHAEINAIREAARLLGSWRLSECELYVTLEPCPMCLSACQQARVKRVVYGAVDKKGGALSLGFHCHDHPGLNHRFEVQCEPTDACSKILSDFFLRRRNEKKSAKVDE